MSSNTQNADAAEHVSARCLCWFYQSVFTSSCRRAQAFIFTLPQTGFTFCCVVSDNGRTDPSMRWRRFSEGGSGGQEVRRSRLFSCPEGRMLRQRRVVQVARGDGRPCPPQTRQWKACAVQPCYRWTFSAWSSCRVDARQRPALGVGGSAHSLTRLSPQDVECGHGTRSRNLTCVVSDGSGSEGGGEVDEELCEGVEPAVDGDTALKEACTLPCPGSTHTLSLVRSSRSKVTNRETQPQVEIRARSCARSCSSDVLIETCAPPQR